MTLCPERNKAFGLKLRELGRTKEEEEDLIMNTLHNYPKILIFADSQNIHGMVIKCPTMVHMFEDFSVILAMTSERLQNL